ncbi:MAG TPA: hypothetical protein VG938_12000 [Verrucomicrobiae bacterium]|jgi:hypothetical protein|nr:hypothetical protein [Verrucomicrobiae bacterium]
MVKAGLRFLPILALALLPVLNLPARDFADYQLGDKAEEDIVATTKLSVVDPEGTQALKEKEAMRVLAIVRYDTNAPDELEARFREVFARTREDFLNSVHKDFGHRKLSAEELSSFKFESLAMLFQKQNKLFPLSTNRAALWASGDTDDAYVTSLIPTLRQTMTSPIRPEPLPADLKLGNTVRLIALGDTNAILPAQTAERLGKNFTRSNFVALADVKKEFQNFFPQEERNIAKYLATLLTPNCFVDEEITRQLRTRRTEGIWSVINYEPGEIVAHRGQVIDGKIKAALDQLKEKAIMGQLQELQVKQQAAVGQLEQLAAAGQAKSAEAQAHIRWLIGGLAAVVLILAAAIWRLARRREPVSLLPAPAAAGALEWQQRALTAEHRTDQLQTAARAGLIAHLSQWLSSMLTRRLIFQRRLLLDSQSNAANEMAELEARLERVQAPLQVRLAAYEHRIAELEKELAARGEENRELLKAKIEMMRKQLEAERGKNRLEFN